MRINVIIAFLVIASIIMAPVFAKKPGTEDPEPMEKIGFLSLSQGRNLAVSYARSEEQQQYLRVFERDDSNDNRWK